MAFDAFEDTEDATMDTSDDETEDTSSGDEKDTADYSEGQYISHDSACTNIGLT